MQEIAPGIYVVKPEGKPIYPYSNSVWIDDGLSLLIDVGAGSRVYQRELTRPVDIVLLSHAHFDHLHCSDLFLNSAMWAAAEEAIIYRDEAAYLSFHGYDHWNQMMGGIPRPPYGDVNPVGDDVPVKPGYRYFELAGLIEDGTVFSTDRYTLRAVHLPGHTQGHYGFLIEELNMLISGDLDFHRGGPGYYNASGDVGELLRSIERVKRLDPERAVPSHRGVQQGEMASKLDAYARPVLERIERLCEYLAIPRRERDMYEIKLLFSNPAHIYEDFWNRMTMLHHLEHLRAAGLVREIEPGVLQRV